MKYTTGLFTWSIWEDEEPKSMDFELYKEIVCATRFFSKILPDRVYSTDFTRFLNEVIKTQRELFPKETAIYDALL